MSWTDKSSIEHIKKIRDIFKVDTFIETGTYNGMNVLTHKDNFDFIFSCEKSKEYYNIALENVHTIKRKAFISVYNQDSKGFLKTFDKNAGNTIFYLDAHFYDPKRPKGKGKFVVLDELKTLKGFKNAIIIIHDFDNNLGHITYDGVPLDMKLLKKDLLKVNPDFKFYTNQLSSCDILKIKDTNNKAMKKDLIYVWSKPEKTYRGILYAVPKKINIEGLREII